ncbi:hypothetical protein ACH42_11535 [Endozoicomonas sp. (ex Bugula neritina AB1)]|nr:hypothetical protein ACH42_11535 [Endozoicomonas sp. (ex Bugula neritina AB1)]
MKGFAIFLALVSSCFLLANIMIGDHGYVLIAFEDMTFESSLWGLLLLVALAIGAIWLVAGLIKVLFTTLGLMVPLSGMARKRRARKLSNRGLTEFTKGHWKKAERLLSQAANAGETPLINYLAAARAAHEAGNNEASATYLRQADSKAPGANMAIGITQAQLQLSSDQLEQALATLTSLHQKHPHHAYILKLLKEVHYRLGDWQSLSKLLPKLRKCKVVTDEQYRELEQKAFKTLFDQAYQRGLTLFPLDEKTKPVIQVWGNLSATQKRDPVTLYRYVNSLAMLGAEQKAEQLMRQNLANSYSEDLIRLYGKVKGSDIKQQLLFAENQLSSRTNDPELLLCLGRLALRNELWGKAREYLEASLELQKSVDTYNELGQLLASLDDFETSTRYFQDGLLLAADTVSGLPHPRKQLAKF